ncbi:unnamed protein product [Meganyctiphanes norvegica]|uniref:Uncharacterized protein n=1 Tax=Meganyctiphanes norvegica TaxID=48144 RepID=A0AAV2Q0T3_MEGNR
MGASITFITVTISSCWDVDGVCGLWLPVRVGKVFSIVSEITCCVLLTSILVPLTCCSWFRTVFSSKSSFWSMFARLFMSAGALFSVLGSTMIDVKGGDCAWAVTLCVVR